MKKIDLDDDARKRVRSLIDDAEKALDDGADDRKKALEYYEGKTPDLPSEPHMSSAVSRDVRGTIRKVLPTLMRSIMSNDKIGTYSPVSPGQDEQAEQATDYVNHVVAAECGAEDAIHDALSDALILRAGVLRWQAVERTAVTVSSFSGKSPDEILGLDALGEIENVEETEGEDGSPLVSFDLRRTEKSVRIDLAAVPRGSFLIHPGASSIEESPIVGERLLLTRSELVARGYDRKIVKELPDATTGLSRTGGEDRASDGPELDSGQVNVLDLHVRLDLDGDGIDETYHIVMAPGGLQNGVRDEDRVLECRAASEVPYAAVCVERKPWSFDGTSVADNLMDLQRVRTDLLRKALDNLQRRNHPLLAIDPSGVENLDAVMKPVPGKPVFLKPGMSAGQVLQQFDTENISGDVFSFMEYLGQQAQERTGITDSSGGLDAEAISGVTATAAQLVSDAGAAQADLMLRTAVRGVERAFEGLLRLIVAHADKSRAVWLRGGWVEFDPRAWDADMKFAVNIGLGAGSRAQDMQALQMILGVQREFVAQGGMQNPFVKPDQLYNTLARLTEAAGLPSADPYFTRPDPAELEQMAAAAAEQPDPKAEIEQAKLQSKMELEAARAQARVQVENAQMEADLQVKRAEIEAERLRAQMALDSDAALQAQRVEMEMRQHRDKMALEYAKLGAGAGVAPALPMPAPLHEGY